MDRLFIEAGNRLGQKKIEGPEDYPVIDTYVIESGYDCGTSDGDFGIKTDKAVEELQSAKTFLSIDGVLKYCPSLSTYYISYGTRSSRFHQ